MEEKKEKKIKGHLPLTEEEAVHRKENIGSITYNISLVVFSKPKYSGNTVIEVELLKTDPGLFIDFYDGEIHKIILNNTTVNPKDVYANGRIKWPEINQLKGRNIVQVVYTTQFDKASKGFYYSNATGKPIFFTNLEPFYANHVFPCFDQPDIKGYFRLVTFTPFEMNVVSNEFEESASHTDQRSYLQFLGLYNIDPIIIPKVGKARLKMRKFKRTQNPLPTYLFVVVVGQFDVTYVEATKDTPPLRIYSRYGYKKYIFEKLDEILEMTKKGIRLFQDFFQTPYPFSKYDQCFVPNLEAGAMENAACTTLDWSLIDNDRENLYYLVMHELAHQWFGDCVTCKWWSHLWLNEAFATYFGRLCCARIPGIRKYGNTWEIFVEKKAYLYKSLHHPILNSIADTKAAKDTFDLITYEKGAAILKQLMYTIGEDAFRKSLNDYLTTFKWRNSETDDLIKFFAKYAGDKLDVAKWRAEWIAFGAYSNELIPQIEIEDGKIKKFVILQKMLGAGKLHSHTVCILLVDQTPKEWKLIDGIRVNPEDVTEVKELAGIIAPAAVFINAGDYAFAKVELDDRSKAYFSKMVEQIDERIMPPYKDVTSMLIRKILLDSQY